MMNLSSRLQNTAVFLKNNCSTLLFSGAGISVESGIPPFRGKGGLWEKYDPRFINIDWFYQNPAESWRQIKEVFYDNWGDAKPNPAHFAVAELQKLGVLNGIVTQNIDCLHQRAGARNVVEFHGTLDRLVCRRCDDSFEPSPALLKQEIPSCPNCQALLKPDFVFFGEDIPRNASDKAFEFAQNVSAVIVVGTTGEVMPACLIPREAKRNGALVIEVNPEESAFTRDGVTDLFFKASASEILPTLLELIQCP